MAEYNFGIRLHKTGFLVSSNVTLGLNFKILLQFFSSWSSTLFPVNSLKTLKINKMKSTHQSQAKVLYRNTSGHHRHRKDSWYVQGTSAYLRSAR